MIRSKAREEVFKLIYELELTDSLDYETIKRRLYEVNIEDQYNYGLDVLTKLVDNKEEVINLINSVSDNWNVNHMAKVDLAIIELATVEIKYLSDIDKAVSCNEAVKLAKKYGDEKSYKFINGILSKID